MQNFLKSATAFVILQVSIVAVVQWYGHRHHSNHFFASLYQKQRRLETTPGNRVVLVGGSSVAFGIKSELIREEMNLEPVNAGVHAGLNLQFHLKLVEPTLRRGDVVVLLLENELWFKPSYDQRIHQDVKFNTPEFATLASPNENHSLRLARDYLDRTMIENLKACIHRGRERFGREVIGRPQELRLYSRAAFNKFGDHSAHWTRNGHIPKPPVRKRASSAAAPKINPNTAGAFDEFLSRCKLVGAQCVYSYPPTVIEDLPGERHRFQTIEQFLQSKGCPILGSADDFTFEHTLFFDSNLHLTGRGAALRTQRLVALLDRFLKQPNRYETRVRWNLTQEPHHPTSR